MTESILRHRPTLETAPSPCRGRTTPAGPEPLRPEARPRATCRQTELPQGDPRLATAAPDPHTVPTSTQLRTTPRSDASSAALHRASTITDDELPLERGTHDGWCVPFRVEARRTPATSGQSVRALRRRASGNPSAAEDVVEASRSDADQRTPHRGSTAGSPNVIVHRQATVSDRHRTTASTRRRSQRVRTRQREGRTGRTVRLDGHRLESDTASSAPAPTTRRRSCSDGYHRSQHSTRRRR